MDQPDNNHSYDPDFQVPCTAAFEFVTPEAAKQMLAAGNRHNRRLMDFAVRRLKGISERHEWMYDSTDAIGVATDGSVVNGQHRLHCIADSGIGVWVLVVRGVRPEVIKIIDQGMGRSLAQTLAIQGGFADPRATATALEWMYKMTGHFEKSMPTEADPTQPQLLQLLEEHPHVVDSVEPAKAVQVKVNVLSRGVYAAYHYAMSCADPDLADEFFTQLATGLEVGDGDPAYVLRERFTADRLKPADKQLRKWEAMAFLVIAWEAARRGEALSARQLRITRSGRGAQQVPTVQGVDWLGTVAPPAEETPPAEVPA
jgi:hypothetical protein